MHDGRPTNVLLLQGGKMSCHYTHRHWGVVSVPWHRHSGPLEGSNSLRFHRHLGKRCLLQADRVCTEILLLGE